MTATNQSDGNEPKYFVGRSELHKSIEAKEGQVTSFLSQDDGVHGPAGIIYSGRGLGRMAGFAAR
jgi:hypothetical protein